MLLRIDFLLPQSYHRHLNHCFCSIKVCQGPYDPILLGAWDTWNTEHGSENDDPKLFPENQVCVRL